MTTKDSVFKSGVISFSITEFCLLWGIIYTAFQNYDPIHYETLGITMAITAAAGGSLILIVIIIELLKWKSD